MDCFTHTAIYLAKTERKGRGMFTREQLPAGILLELSPIIALNASERTIIGNTLMREYIFGWENDGCCVALGTIAMYNHAYEANCTYEKDYTQQTISIRTVHPIAAGQELTINYNGSPDHQGPLLWFDAE